jgi:hypothetical protein
VELEHTPILGHFDGLIEIDTIGEPNELDTERRASRNWTEHVAKEDNSLHLVQLGRADFFAPAAEGDRARPAARNLRTQLSSPQGAQTQRLPESLMVATGVVRGRPL